MDQASVSTNEGETLKSIAKSKGNGIKKDSMKQQKNPCWNEQDLRKLERCISILGTDFDIIQKLFSNRTRKQILNKYKKSKMRYNADYRSKFNRIQSELKELKEVSRHRFKSVDSVDINVALEINEIMGSQQQ